MAQDLNYNKYKEILKSIDKSNKPKILVHACCGPCSTAVLEKLNDYFDVTIYYYNPNIYPESEYELRYDQFKNIPILKNIIKGDYKEEEYYNAINNIKDYDKLREGDIRCFSCYEFRLENTAKLAKEKGFDYFTTTLSISPYKNSDWINELGDRLSNKYNIKFLYSNFKKEEGYKESIKLSKDFGLYRQEYCGCIFSLNEKNLLQK